MKADADLSRLAAKAGLFEAFVDMQGITRVAGPDTQRALLRANGIAANSPSEVRDSLAQMDAEHSKAFTSQDVVIEAGAAQQVPIARPARFTVCAEDTEEILVEGRAEAVVDLLPLPDGVHSLHLEDAAGRQCAHLIAAPVRTPSIEDICGRDRIWGATAALYGLVGEAGKTLGDYRDLADLAAAFGSVGADFVGINPVHALGFSATDTISPYSPTHRGFLNADHIALTYQTPAQNGAKLLDYPEHRARHHAALRSAFEAFSAGSDTTARAGFEVFCKNGAAALETFARFEALSEKHGPDWRRWPTDAVEENACPRATAFHKWLQWHADKQLAKAQGAANAHGLGLGLYLDLAVGARRGGAESWGAEAPVAEGVSLGAPPDHLSPAGQNWQLSAFAPSKMQKCKYANFRQVLRQSMRHAGLLRIDHALGLNRSYWIPDDGSPGGYVRQPFKSLKAIIAIEAVHAGCVIVGEDLGLVPDGFRQDMALSGFYGYSVLQYEKDKNGQFKPLTDLRHQSLACFGTHDTPTLAGYWGGRDIAWWKQLGWIGQKDAAKEAVRRARDKWQLVDLPAQARTTGQTPVDVRDAVHARLASTPVAMVAVQLDDILQVEEAQNLPGTVSEHPNWLRRYPLTLAEIAQSDDLSKTGDIMALAGRANAKWKDNS